jgi:anti-sigma B factor antagonist
MFDISKVEDGKVSIRGRLDAAQVERAREVFDLIETSCDVDFEELAYISSAGLGLLFATQKRLVDEGEGLRLINLNPHIREVFQIAGFDNVFEIA